MFGLRSARSRAVLAGVVLLALMASVVSLAVWHSRDEERRHDTVERTFTVATALEGVHADFSRQQAALVGFLLSGDPALVDDYRDAGAAVEEHLSQARTEALAEGMRDEFLAVEDLAGRIEQFNQRVDLALPFLLQVDPATAVRLAIAAMSQMVPEAEAITADLEKLVQGEQLDLAAATAAADRDADTTLGLLISLSVLAFLVAAATIGTLMVSVVRPLASLRASARAITSGDLEARATVSGPEEVASLARDFNEMTDALFAKTEEYIATTNLTGEIVGRVDKYGNWTFLNDAACQFYGKPREELLGTDSKDSLHPDDIAPAVEAVQRAATAREPISGFVNRQITPMGTRVVEWNASPFFDADGRYAGIQMTGRDITERKRMEEALRESEERYRDLVENINEIIYSVDSNGIITYVSPVVERLGGYTPSEVIGRPVTEFIHPDDLGPLMESFQRTVSGNLEPFEYRVLTKSGEAHWVRTSSRPVFEGDRLVGLRAVLMDITDRKRAEDALRESEERFRDIADHAHEWIWEVDTNGTYTYVSPVVERSLGYKPDELLGKHFYDLFHPEDREELKKAAFEVFAKKQAFREFLNRNIHKDGRVVWLATSGVPVLDEQGNLLGYRGADTDVTERKQVEDALRESEERYRLLAEHASDVIWTMDLSLRYTYVSPSIVRMRGYSPEELVGETVQETLTPDSLELARKTLAEELAQERAGRNDPFRSRTLELEMYHKDGSTVWTEVKMTFLRNPEGQPVGILGVTRDISERKKAEEKIWHLGYHDALTGLPNRLLFQDRLAQAVAQARRHRQMLTVMSLDLDRFKLINDTLGHTAGDDLLQAVAKRLAGLVREGDTIARVGGDEFVLLFPGTIRVEHTARIAQKILEALRQPFRLDGHELHTTTSVGVSLYPYDASDAETLLKNADAALYRAKEQGRDNYQLYTPAMTAQALGRLALENGLRQALEREEFVAYYQPQAEINGGRIVGAEALVRWQHPERGLLSAREFIPLAEETGLIVPLGEWMLRAACAQNKAWQEAGLSPLRMAVNLSARQFQQPDLVEMVGRVLKETGLNPDWLELEITETTAMEDRDVAIAALRDLREMGVRVSMDDFGVGYCSLSYLKDFPIDALKIDQSFVRDLPEPNAAAIVTAIIAAAHSLDLAVIAEGVESEQQLAFLRGGGCDKFQGYLLAEPMAAESFKAMLRKGKRLRGRRRAKVTS